MQTSSFSSPLVQIYELTGNTQYIYFSLLRRSKDYVYGIWVYKALGIWKGYYRVKTSLVSYMKSWTEARNNKNVKYHSKLTYQLSFWNVSRKVDYHAGGKWFIHGPKRGVSYPSSNDPTTVQTMVNKCNDICCIFLRFYRKSPKMLKLYTKLPQYRQINV